MNINQANLDILFKGYNILFNKGFSTTQSHRDTVSMLVKSNTSEETYGWLGQWPGMREWIGDRIIHQLSRYSYGIKNETFESTVEIKRTVIEDDQFGLFGNAFEQMGRMAKRHPDTLLLPFLKSGFIRDCYDGQYFFDQHPIYDENDKVVLVSNMQTGTGPAWYLLDCSQSVKPLIFQERLPYEFTAITNSGDERVFMKDSYLYGVRARLNVGFGLWQTAFGSKAELNAENYAAAREQMLMMRGDRGQLLGINPTHLVVSPMQEAAARQLLKATTVSNDTNIWHESVELIVSPFAF